MKQEYTARTARLLGQEKVDLLGTKTVLLFGLGGVGSYVAEALARAGVGHLILVDADTFEASNINRQLCATVQTLGKYKCDVERSGSCPSILTLSSIRIVSFICPTR